MTQPDIRRPVVAGAGTMGTTLARIFAQHGFAVTLWNRRTPSLERAQARIAGDLDRLAAQGLLTEDPAAIARRVTYTTDYAAFDGADFVVENIAEDLAVKQAFFREISPRVAPEALLTTNTSGLRVTDVAQGVEDPTRFCGMHWWNPPDLMPLVEITRGGPDQPSRRPGGPRPGPGPGEEACHRPEGHPGHPRQPPAVCRDAGGPPHPGHRRRRSGGNRRSHEVRPRVPLRRPGPL